MTLKDFRAFAREVGFKIFKETAVNISGQRQKGTIIHFLPDFRANYGIYLIGKGKT